MRAIFYFVLLGRHIRLAAASFIARLATMPSPRSYAPPGEPFRHHAILGCHFLREQAI